MIHTASYKQGALRALDDLGMNLEELRAPYPSKNPELPAERLSRMLQKSEETDIPRHIAPDNKGSYREDRLDRPVTWSAPTNISNMYNGQRVPGLMLPGSPRS